MKAQNLKLKMLCLLIAVVCIFYTVVYAVGKTRLSGSAGTAINLNTYLAGDLGELNVPLKINNLSWEYGTGAGAVNVIYADTISLLDANSVTVDLYASGSYTDIYNRALTMSALKFLYIYNGSSDATLLVGGGASNDLLLFADTSDIVKIPPGSSFTWVYPSAAGIVTTTNKNLKLEHDGTGTSSMSINIIAMGLD